MNRQEKIATLLGDILIPILGFFLWNWSIYFICLFFLLDQLAREISQLIRVNKLKVSNQISPSTIIVNVILFIGLFCLVHLFNLLLKPSISFFNEMNHFFWYKDTGIPQGFILFPLLFYVERLRYRMNTKVFSMEIHWKHWRLHTVQLLLYVFLFALLSVLLAFLDVEKTLCFILLIIGFALVTLCANKISTFFPS